MEVQHLDTEDRDAIKRVSDVWKIHRAAIASSDIMPIGNEPNGSALTGFLCTGAGYGYVIALREVCDDDSLKISLPFDIKNPELLSSSNGVKLSFADKELKFEFTDMRQFAFCRFEM